MSTVMQPAGDLTEVDIEAHRADETIIERGLGKFVEVGEALARIRDRRSYRATHDTFEAYCQEKWGLSRSRSYRLIDAAETVGAMSPIGDTPLPANEGQARELSGLDPQDAAQVMRAAADSGDVTAASIRAARAELSEPEPTSTRSPATRPQPQTPAASVRSAETTKAADMNVDNETDEVLDQPQPPRQRRRPLPDAFANALHGLGKNADTLARLTEDDRFLTNRTTIAMRSLAHAKKAADTLAGVLAAMQNDDNSQGA